MAEDTTGLASEGEIGFMTRMAILLPALGIADTVPPTQVCRMLGLRSSERNCRLIRDIQSYRVIVWRVLPTSTRIEIAFGDDGNPSDYDFYFER